MTKGKSFCSGPTVFPTFCGRLSAQWRLSFRLWCPRENTDRKSRAIDTRESRKFRFSFRARCYCDWLHSKSFTILLHFAEKFEGTGAEFSSDDFLGQVSASRKFCFLLLLTDGGFSSENGAFVTFFVASPNWRCSAHQREFLGLKLQNVGISH